MGASESIPSKRGGQPAGRVEAAVGDEKESLEFQIDAHAASDAGPVSARPVPSCSEIANNRVHW